MVVGDFTIFLNTDRAYGKNIFLMLMFLCADICIHVGEEYETKTRGHKHKPPAKELGKGVHHILSHQLSEDAHPSDL